MESGEGQSPQEIMLLPEEDRKMLGRQNPHAFFIFSFSVEKTKTQQWPAQSLVATV